jgi:hypothetical protein
MHTMQILKNLHEVTYQPETVIVDDAAMQFMAAPIIGNDELVFDAAAEPHLSLEKGKVTIFPLAALRRVVDWRKVGDQIFVDTQPAILTDAIRDADIDTLVQISWNDYIAGLPKQGRTVTFNVFPQALAASSPTASISRSFQYKFLTVTIKFMPKAGNVLAYELTVKVNRKVKTESIVRGAFPGTFPTEYLNRDQFQPVSSAYAENLRSVDGGADYTSSGGETNAAPDSAGANDRRQGTVSVGGDAGTKGFVKATGQISGFQQAFSMRVENSTLSDLNVATRSLKADVKVESASLAGVVGTFYIQVPLKYSFLVPIGVIPLKITIGADVSFRPIVSEGTSGSTKLCFAASYDASMGIRYNAGAFSNQSEVKDREANRCVDSETVSAGTLTVGMGATVKLPTVQVSLFNMPASVGFDAQLDTLTTYEPGIASALDACQAGKVDLAAIVNAKLDFLGFNSNAQYKLWQDKKEWTCGKKMITTKYDKGSGERVTETDL